jgi:nucleoside-diphosphate-sugar epimerase
MITEEKIVQPVLIAGAIGFIGSRVVYKLLKNNIAMIAPVLPHKLAPTEWAEKIEITRGSISDSQAYEPKFPTLKG